ncbi:hypothetical protein [Paenibacillus sp. Soil522]|uniref:hypothetical protein n=1 Tax=Paenibacillus sp. Soil522 TaxID=1736388 RepID=UPI0006F6D5B4|nr:hypothetical protein [Paenibacillus sp. Soil522]KRE37315.1 hypothetical protein ASG81_20135 [Paenibacillus sp. Soil522]
MYQFAKHYGVMWIVFVLLVSIGALGVEILEGEKITTTEYYGLHNLGYMYFALIFLFIALPTSGLYFIIVLPLSILLRKGTYMMFCIRTVIITVMGAVEGNKLFHQHYSNFIEGYELNYLTAVIVFGMCGLAYSLIDGVLAKKAAWVML